MIRPNLFTIIAAASIFIASSGNAATVVDSKIGRVYLEANSFAFPEHDPFVFGDNSEYNYVNAYGAEPIFFGTPHDLSTSVSVNSSGVHNLASLAANVNAVWSSADHGVISLNILSSLYDDGASVTDTEHVIDRSRSIATGFSLNRNLFENPEHTLEFWQYNFTPTVDSKLTLDVSKIYQPTHITGRNENMADYIGFSIDNDVKDQLYDGSSLSYYFLGGQNYTIGLRSLFTEIVAEQGAYESLDINTLSVTFDFTASAPDPMPNPTPSPTTPAVPEPATWAMMVLGLGMVGRALRDRRAVARRASLSS